MAVVSVSPRKTWIGDASFPKVCRRPSAPLLSWVCCMGQESAGFRRIVLAGAILRSQRKLGVFDGRNQMFPNSAKAWTKVIFIFLVTGMLALSVTTLTSAARSGSDVKKVQ